MRATSKVFFYPICALDTDIPASSGIPAHNAISLSSLSHTNTNTNTHNNAIGIAYGSCTRFQTYRWRDECELRVPMPCPIELDGSTMVCGSGCTVAGPKVRIQWCDIASCNLIHRFRIRCSRASKACCRRTSEVFLMSLGSRGCSAGGSSRRM